MDTKKTLIFDFDGTIADSGIKIYEILNEILPSFGIKKVKESEIERLRGMNAKQLLKEFDVPIYKVPLVFYEFEKEYQKIIKDLKPIPGIMPVLKTLNEMGVGLHIASSNSVESISLFLETNDIKYFDLIKGNSGMLGKSRIIKKIISEKKLLPEEVIYVGDEIRDVESARKVGIKSAAVTWGFNTKKVLEECEPDYLISKPEELLNLE